MAYLVDISSRAPRTPVTFCHGVSRLLAMWGERWSADMLVGCLMERMRASGGGNEMASEEER
ncbi:hypothetical protein FB107DRAFT_222706 [Schizophyllum commune]